jgi:hypothetical protein
MFGLALFIAITGFALGWATAAIIWRYFLRQGSGLITGSEASIAVLMGVGISAAFWIVAGLLLAIARKRDQ